MVVVQVASPGFSIAPGSNAISPSVEMYFPSQPTIQDKVALFVNEIVANGPGTTKEYFTVTGLSFGTSQSTAYKFLSKIVVGLKSSTIINVDMINKALALLSDGSVNPASLIEMVKVSSIDVNFNPSSTIDNSITAQAPLPHNIAISMPFFGASVDFGSQLPFVDFYVDGLSFEAPNIVHVPAHETFNDTPEIAAAIAAVSKAFITKQPLPGEIGGGKLLFGLDRQNAIDTFAKVDVAIPLQTAFEKFQGAASGLAGSIDINRLISSLGLVISDIKMSTAPMATLKTSLTAAFQNQFQLTVNNFGYMTTAAGIDGISVALVQSTGASIVPGSNKVAVSADLLFPHSTTIQQVIAKFGQDLLDKGFGNTPEVFTMTGASFGYDHDHAFKFLSKAMVGIPSSYVMNMQNVNYLLELFGISGGVSGLPPATSLLSMIDLRSANLDGTEPGKLLFATEVGVKNMAFNADVDIGFAGLSAFINGVDLADVSVVSGLSLKSTQGEIVLSLENEIVMQEGEQIQDMIAKLVGLLTLPEGTPVPEGAKAVVGVGGLLMGSSTSDVVDSFKDLVVGMDVLPYVPQIKSFLLGTISGLMSPNSTIGYTIDRAVVDAVGELTLNAEVGVSFTGLPPNIKVNLPYATAHASWDGSDFVQVEIKDILFQDNKFSTSIDLNFAYNPAIAQQVVPIVGYIVFHHPLTVTNVVSVTGVAFGEAADSTFKTFSKAQVASAINDAVQIAYTQQDQERPLVLRDIHATVDENGIESSVSADALTIPLEVKLTEIYANVTYQIGGVGRFYNAIGVYFHNFNLKPYKNITFDLLLAPQVDDAENGILVPMEEDVPLMISWQDYAEHARLGYLTLVGSNGAKFRALDTGYFQPPALYLWQPFTINIVGTNPFRNIGQGVVLPIGVDISFPNPGPLHLDGGHVSIQIIDTNNKPFFEVSNTGNFVVKNELEGGNENGGKGNPLNGLLTMSLPWSDFNPLELFVILDNLFMRRMTTDIAITRDGKRIVWVDKIIRHLMNSDALSIIPKLIGVIIAHIRIKLFGFPVPLTKLPGFRRFAEHADQFMATIPNNTIQITGGDF